ncbi:hypothetical protein F4779DRAFT_412338 [Xylariaceae sp. FL0662B]|nr:hypothetical protein F4779DRAFT_412338 [Xylariaceae sp. FL0662B]
MELTEFHGMNRMSPVPLVIWSGKTELYSLAVARMRLRDHGFPDNYARMQLTILLADGRCNLRLLRGFTTSLRWRTAQFRERHMPCSLCSWLAAVTMMTTYAYAKSQQPAGWRFWVYSLIFLGDIILSLTGSLYIPFGEPDWYHAYIPFGEPNWYHFKYLSGSPTGICP